MKLKTLTLFIAILISSCGPKTSEVSQDSLPSASISTSTSLISETTSETTSLIPSESEINTSSENPDSVTLDIYAINDMHGAVVDKNGNAGIAKTSTYLKNAKVEKENTVFLSSGDMWQGSSESNNTKGLLVTDWMNDLGFESLTLGNHEFDWQISTIETNQQFAEFPFLAINIFDNDTNEPVSYSKPSVMVERQGLKIGIIGAIGNVYSSILSYWVEDVHFKTGSALTKLVKDEAIKLREEGADLIIYSMHAGYSSGGSTYPSRPSVSPLSASAISSFYDSSLSDGYVDLVFEGHTHQKTVYTDPYGVYHLQAGGYGEAISYVNLTFDKTSDQFSVNEADMVYTSSFINLAEDEYTNGLFDKYSELIGDIYSTIGANATQRSGAYLGQVVADLYIEKAVEVWEDYDIVLGGGFLQSREPYSLAPGAVNVSMVQELFPFDNNLVLCSIRGSDLLSKFINSSNSNYYVSFSDYGNTIRNSISSSATYYIVVDQYTSAYAPNNLTDVVNMNPPTFAYQLLTEYIRAGGLA